MEKSSSGRWIIASNRLPFRWDNSAKKLEASSGGLVTAISGIKSDQDTIWVGIAPDGISKSEWDESIHDEGLRKHFPIFVSEDSYEHYYNGMCNNVLWPLLHYESNQVLFTEENWQAYCDVNEAFAQSIAEIAKSDDLVWIHDFHLFLVPQLLKEKRPELKVGLFLHTPFPSSEVFRQLPVRVSILKSAISADLVGFHDYSYLRHFISSVYYLLGLQSNMLSIQQEHHLTKVGVFPVSIDTSHFKKQASSTEVKKQIKKFRDKQQFEYLILGVDRLDYIKGVKLKLQAFSQMLEDYPEIQGKVSLLQIAVPSRTEVPGYQNLKNEVEQLVGEINGHFGKPHLVPVQYMFSSVSFEELLALYRLADVLLVTSKRDGMNLVALEYLASQKKSDPGVVVLSEFAGAISTLSHVIPTNPWDISETAGNMYQALTLDDREKTWRHKAMINYLDSYTATDWAKSFMDNLQETLVDHQIDTSIALNPHDAVITENGSLFKQGIEKIVIFLDYDGTLVPICEYPDQAVLEERERKELKKIIAQKNVELVIVSGRGKRFLSHQLQGLDVFLAPEHGSSFYDYHQGKWKTLIRTDKKEWYDKVTQIMSDYTVRVPGSFIEKKNFCVAWHYRKSPVEFAEFQARKLRQDLENTLMGIPVNVQIGKKIVEVKALEANKGAFINWFLDAHSSQVNASSLIAIGDDQTDEDMFSVLEVKGGASIKVGQGSTCASYRLRTQHDVLSFLQSLKEIS